MKKTIKMEKIRDILYNLKCDVDIAYDATMEKAFNAESGSAKKVMLKADASRYDYISGCLEEVLSRVDDWLQI